MVCDLERFRAVNDRRPEAGDLLLAKVAER